MSIIRARKAMQVIRKYKYNKSMLWSAEFVGITGLENAINVPVLFLSKMVHLLILLPTVQLVFYVCEDVFML